MSYECIDHRLFTVAQSDISAGNQVLSVDISQLQTALQSCSCDYVYFDYDRPLNSDALLSNSSTATADIFFQRFLHEEPMQPPAQPITIPGPSMGERVISGLPWHLDLRPSLLGKVFRRSYLCRLIAELPPDCLSIPESAFFLYAIFKADTVVLADSLFSSNGNNQQSFLADDFNYFQADAACFHLFGQLGRLLNSHSVYLKQRFATFVASSYSNYLQSLVDGLANNDVSNTLAKMRPLLQRYPDFASLLYLEGVPLLPTRKRLLINTIESGRFNFAGINGVCADTEVPAAKKILDSQVELGPVNEASLQRPLVSIVTVVRNLVEGERVGLFEMMLDSVLTQDYPRSRIEHMVVDGASTDGTLEYLSDLWESGRISKLISEPDTSVYNAMNKSMSYLNGDFFLFLNSDDFFSPDAVSALIDALVSDASDYAFADIWQIDARNNKIKASNAEIDSAWFKVPYCHQTLMCRTIPLSRHRFDESYAITMMQYATDLRAASLKWSYVPKKLAFYRMGDGLSSAPENFDRYMQEVYRVKDYTADLLGLSRERYKALDDAWQNIAGQQDYQQFLSLVDATKAIMPISHFTEKVVESVKRFGAYRLAKYKREYLEVPEDSFHVALFSSHSYGGAGNAVLRLHLPLRDTPWVHPTLVTRDMVASIGSVPDKHLIEQPEVGWNARQHLVRTAPGSTQFTVDEGCIQPEALDEIIASHEVFSLQWTARMLSVRDIGRIVDSGKPVFITVRDMEPITGGCHYFHGCNHWRYRQCQDCPQIVVGDKRLASEAFAEKLKVLTRPNVTFVVLSDLTESVLRQSPIAYANPIVKIGNGFDPDTLRILDRQQARRALGLDEAFAERYLIGMMPSFNSTVKGFDVALSALREAEQQSVGFQDRCGLLVAGYPANSEDLGISLPMEAIGVLGDAGALNLFYSACDLVIVPSREETFSNTVAEALLCGTPVLGAMAGAIPEMITDDVNGRLFSHDWDSARIAEALIACCENDFSRETCRAAITEGFSQHQQVARYVALFSQALGD